MKPRRSAWMISMALLVVACAAIAAGASARAWNTASTTFTDPAGDSSGAPDLNTVAISDDYATGTITVTVTAAGYAADVPDGATFVKIYLNTDKNAGTGALDQDGTEYYVEAFKEPDGSGWAVKRWDGSEYVLVSQSPTMSFVRSGDVLTWTLSRSDIGGTSGFTFFAWSAKFDANNTLVAEDVAPDDGAWSYDLATAPPPKSTTTPAAVVKPLIGKPVTTPAVATAGKPFTVSFPVTRSDNGMPLTTGRMICDPSVQAKVIKHAESFRGGTARLSFTVPKSAKGKVLKVKVTIKAGTQSTTGIATFRVH